MEDEGDGEAEKAMPCHATPRHSACLPPTLPPIQLPTQPPTSVVLPAPLLPMIASRRLALTCGSAHTVHGGTVPFGTRLRELRFDDLKVLCSSGRGSDKRRGRRSGGCQQAVVLEVAAAPQLPAVLKPPGQQQCAGAPYF